MENNQLATLEQCKKKLKELWGLLIVWFFLAVVLYCAHVFLDFHGNDKTMHGFIVLAVIIVSNIWAIIRLKKMIREKEELGEGITKDDSE